MVGATHGFSQRAVAVLIGLSLSLHDFSLVQGAPSSRSVRWSAHGSSAPFFVGGVVTMAYDLTLWWLLRRVKPPEEVAEG